MFPVILDPVFNLDAFYSDFDNHVYLHWIFSLEYSNDSSRARLMDIHI